jgi:hypothetical protein
MEQSQNIILDRAMAERHDHKSENGLARDARGRFLARDPGGRGNALRRSIHAVRTRPSRRDGWTAARRETFLAVLAETCNVTIACESVGMSDVGAYKLRRRDAAFRKAWRSALTEGYARLEIKLLERALIGEAKLREAIDATDAARAIDLLGRYSPRTAELLYRTHRTEALAADSAEPDADEPEDAKLIASIMAKLTVARATLIAEDGAA